MTIRIKATGKEFEAACTNGCVYGEIRGKRGLYVYAELGEERDYIPSVNDNSMASVHQQVSLAIVSINQRLRQWRAISRLMSNSLAICRWLCPESANKIILALVAKCYRGAVAID